MYWISTPGWLISQCMWILETRDVDVLSCMCRFEAVAAGRVDFRTAPIDNSEITNKRWGVSCGGGLCV